MGRPTTDTEQITLRVPSDWVVRADILSEVLAPSAETTFGKRDVFLAAIAHGLEKLEGKLSGPPERAPRTRAPKRAPAKRAAAKR